MLLLMPTRDTPSGKEEIMLTHLSNEMLNTYLGSDLFDERDEPLNLHHELGLDKAPMTWMDF